MVVQSPNRPPLVDADPRHHVFLPWSLDPSRCRVMVRIGTGYTHCARPLAAHSFEEPT